MTRGDTHVQHIRALFDCLVEVHLTINLVKCEFAKTTVTYLGRVVGQGYVLPIDVKVGSVAQYPVPTTERADVFFGLGRLLM